MLVLIALQGIYFHGVKFFICHWKYSYFVESVFEEIIFLGEGSFVPHDDTFSIKSFSSLLHFSALGALLKCF